MLPSVDGVLNDDRVVGWSERWGRAHVKAVLREVLEDQRRLVESGGSEAAEIESILRAVQQRLVAAERPVLRPVLNGTGVVLHTNLGRAPLAQEALAAIVRVGSGYSNLEYELSVGERGSRLAHCTHLLRELTGSEAAIVVNNNAAAVALVVNEFAAGKQVVVSRGELVEIGGSFRVPDIVARSGAELVEVGTTNRTRLEDYRRAVGPGTGLILKVHPSNYRITGFVADVELKELVRLGTELGVPVANDLGSGLLFGPPGAEAPPGLDAALTTEPAPAEAVAAGADPITWSGDKLLGGPQAGIIHGSARVVDRLRANPLLRALRVDKLTLAALEATLRFYRNPTAAWEEIPALRMLREPGASVRRRAAAALSRASELLQANVEVRDLKSVVGGGALPGLEIASAGWVVRGAPAASLARACREREPPLIGRIEDDLFCVDFRTILPGEETAVSEALQRALDS